MNLNVNLNCDFQMSKPLLPDVEEEEKISGVYKIPIRTLSFLNTYFQYIKYGKEVSTSIEGKEMCYYSVRLQGRKILFKTDRIKCLFGVWPYQHTYHKEKQYCIHLSIDDSNDEIKQFHIFLDSMDMLCLQVASKEKKIGKYKYHSTVRPNYKDNSLTPCIQVKINQTKEESNVYLPDNENYMKAANISELSKKMIHGKYYDMILEVRNIWFSANRFGISYSLVAVKDSVLPNAFK